MGTQEMPHYKQKQSLLFTKDTKPEELRRQGRRFLEEGWLRDAISFLEKAGDTEGLGMIRDIVVEEGDVFLFKQVLLALDAEASEEEWKHLGTRALDRGKLQFAREAYRMAGDRKAMDQVDKLIAPEEREERPEDELPDPPE